MRTPTPEIRYVYVTPNPISTPYPAPTSRVNSYPQDLQRAFSDYQWRLDLVSEQTQRLDMYYAAKAGTQMSCKEYSAWIDQIRSQTNEFISRNLEAAESGKNYGNQLNANSNNIDIDKANLEIERINQNLKIMSSDIQKATDNLNENVNGYNKNCAS